MNASVTSRYSIYKRYRVFTIFHAVECCLVHSKYCMRLLNISTIYIAPFHGAAPPLALFYSVVCHYFFFAFLAGFAMSLSQFLFSLAALRFFSSSFRMLTLASAISSSLGSARPSPRSRSGRCTYATAVFALS